jgi:hypothetical protein
VIANVYFPAVVGAKWDFEWREWPSDRRGRRSSEIVNAEPTAEGVRVVRRDETPDGTATTRFLITEKGVFREEVTLPKGRFILTGLDLVLPTPAIPGKVWETNFRLETPNLTEVARETSRVAAIAVPVASAAGIFTDCAFVTGIRESSITQSSRTVHATTLVETHWCAKVGLVTTSQRTTDGSYSLEVSLIKYEIPSDSP